MFNLTVLMPFFACCDDRRNAFGVGDSSMTMSQEAPNKKDEEEEVERMDFATLEPPLESAVASVTDEMSSLSQTSGLVSEMQVLSDQFEELTEAMEVVRERNLGSNEAEAERAIQQINSASKTGEGSPSEPQKAAEAVEGLYNEERLEAMRELLQEHNLRIVQQLLASDTGALSPKEVAFRNKSIIAESTVRDHLRELAKKGFVEKLEPDVESIPNTMPQTFYAASPVAIKLLQEMGLWENLGMLYQIYNSLERPEEIQQIERWEGRPKPDWI